MTPETAHIFSEERDMILDAALMEAAFDGFTAMSLKTAAARAGVAPETLAAAFPGGVGDLLALWSRKADEAATGALARPEASALKIREKVARAIEARLDYLDPHKEAARRAAGVLALPIHAPLAVQLTWRSADAIWRALGDASTDFNFYSKRAILSGVLTSTMARWFSDDDPDLAATKAFLAARIENVMQFEKLKARLPDIDLAGVTETLARWRYR